MVFDYRKGAAREFFEVRVGTVLDLILEQRGISFLIIDLPLHIVTIERRALVRVERRNHRVIGAFQQRVGRCRDVLLLQDVVEGIDYRNVRHHHQVGIVAYVGLGGLILSNSAGIDFEREAQIGLSDEIVVYRAQDGHRLRDPSRWTGGLRPGDTGSNWQKREDKGYAYSPIHIRKELHLMHDKHNIRGRRVIIAQRWSIIYCLGWRTVASTLFCSFRAGKRISQDRG